MNVIIQILLLIASIGLLVGSYLLFNHVKGYGCNKHSPTWEDLQTGLNPDYVFKTPQLRTMAESIYSYRIYNNDRKNFPSNYSGIFTSLDPKYVYAARDLSDIALHKLSTCDNEAFDKLMTFAAFFNHPSYASCVNAYDESNKQFRNSEHIRDIIINQIFKVNPIPMSAKDSSPTKVSIVQGQIPKYSDEDLYKLLTNGLF